MEAWKIVAGILLIVMFILCSGGSRGNHTDGIYESAMDKLKHNHADELTDAEAQRIHDVLSTPTPQPTPQQEQ